jgi:hypothetical protein
MRQNDRANTSKEKLIAREKWAERQFDKWVKWAINTNGKIRYKEILFMQKELNITK